mgnify:CR=1 FL=1
MHLYEHFDDYSKEKDWLKSLRPQSQEESVEDKVNNFFDALGDCGYMQDEILLLKSLWKQAGLSQPQSHWKPSDEQMIALNACIMNGEISYVGQGTNLQSLYNDLKILL